MFSYNFSITNLAEISMYMQHRLSPTFMSTNPKAVSITRHILCKSNFRKEKKRKNSKKEIIMSVSSNQTSVH